MRMERFQITNYKAFGEKVKAWARGHDPIPQDLTEFASQLAAANVGATIPARYKTVKFVVQTDDVLLIDLPPTTLIADSEERLTQPAGDYPMPPIYEQVFQSKPTIKDKLGFHAERIADYTISKTG